MADIPVTERLKALRNRAGVSMAAAAQALNLAGASSYQHYEDSSKFTGKYLPPKVVEDLLSILVGRAVAGETPVTQEEVLALCWQPPKMTGDRVEIVPDGNSQRGRRRVPIFSAAQGGKGHLIIDHTPIDELGAPDDLVHVRDPYGILIVGESMVPAYRPGDIAWVNPHKLPERDTDVVLYHVPPYREAEAIIKTLISWSPREWKLRQYQPPLDFTEPTVDWPVCHRIVGKKNAR